MSDIEVEETYAGPLYDKSELGQSILILTDLDKQIIIFNGEMTQIYLWKSSSQELNGVWVRWQDWEDFILSFDHIQT